MAHEHFFEFARERHAIYLRRAAGQSWPWTENYFLQTYRFTNVFREFDKNTVWLRENVRELERDKYLLPAIVLFRWTNRITTGEALFCQYVEKDRTAWELYRWKRDPEILIQAVRAYCGRGPYVTGAYIITSLTGYDKLEGVIRMFDNFYRADEWRHVTDKLLRARGRTPLQETWDWLRTVPYMGTFHSYEVVSDLRHTSLHRHAHDVDTWANPGPGALRGLERIYGQRHTHEEAIVRMRDLLSLSRNRDIWPADWPRWELREVEHTLCEFDKYERVRLGEGRPRSVYRMPT